MRRYEVYERNWNQDSPSSFLAMFKALGRYFRTQPFWAVCVPPLVLWCDKETKLAGMTAHHQAVYTAMFHEKYSDGLRLHFTWLLLALKFFFYWVIVDEQCCVRTRTDFFLSSFLFFRATLMAYGSSQAKGQIGGEGSCWPMGQPQPEPLTHWARLGIELHPHGY